MAYSKCGSCNGTSFEMVEASPRGSRFKLSFIQCASCGVVIGVMDYNNIGADLEGVKKQIKNLQAVTSNIDHNLAVLSQRINR